MGPLPFHFMVLAKPMTLTAADRRIHLAVDTGYVAYLAELDGCYTLKTDVPVQVAEKS